MMTLTQTGSGSKQRSATCPIESGYIVLQSVDGTKYFWFNDAKADELGMCEGRTYRLSARVSAKNTLQNVKFIGEVK